MAYTKTLWKARQCTNPCKFTKSEETADTIVLINTPDSVTEPGTLFSPENMNHIEQGIKDAHDAIDAEAEARGKAVNSHNTSDNAHADIRQLIAAETEARAQGDNALEQAIAAEEQACSTAISSHNTSSSAHADIRQTLAAEEQALAQSLNEYRSLILYLVRCIESAQGPIQRSFPLVVEGGGRLATENGYILTTA